jgi:PAS domain S-box-containing protein
VIQERSKNRNLADRRLFWSEEPLRAILEASRDGILVEDGETIFYVNRAYAQMLGYEPDELRGRHVSLLLAPEDAQRMYGYGQLRLAGYSAPTVYEFKGLCKDGSLIDLEASVSTCLVNDDTYITTSVRDISERKRSEEALRRSEAKYRLLMEQASDGIHTYDLDGNFIEANPKLCEMLGYTREEISVLNVRDLIPAEDVEAAPIRFEELRNGKSLLVERLLRRKDNSFVPVEISGRMVQDGMLQAIVRDISKRKRAEDELRSAYDKLERRVAERTAELACANRALQAEVAERRQAEESRRKLLGRVVTAQEEERRRISRELHDHVGQQLAALIMGLNTLGGESYEPQSSLNTLRKLQAMADQLARETHTLAWGLRPPALDELGLLTALYNYVEEWAERSRVAVDFISTGLDGERLPFAHETALYRVAQEALTNVLKHSGADRVSFIFERRNDYVLAVIEDNGTGFEVETVMESSLRERRFGLLGMRERAELLGGTLDIESSPTAGTSLFIRIPISASRAKENRSHG